MESTLFDSTITAQTGSYPGKKSEPPISCACPLCHTDLDKLVTALKGSTRSQEWQTAYNHVQHDCLYCKVLIKEHYINEFGNWKHS